MCRLLKMNHTIQAQVEPLSQVALPSHIPLPSHVEPLSHVAAASHRLPPCAGVDPFRGPPGTGCHSPLTHQKDIASG